MNKTERIKWLKLATSKNPERTKLLKPFISHGWEIATDGFRIHIGKMDEVPPPKDTNDIHLGRLIKEFKESKAESQFAVNSEYLIEALQGFENPEVIIQVLRNGTLLRLSSKHESTEAYIMCMLPPEEE